jgi:hypothetical protein
MLHSQGRGFGKAKIMDVALESAVVLENGNFDISKYYFIIKF